MISHLTQKMEMTSSMTKISHKKQILSIGVDVGTKNGALCVINEDLQILHASKVPTYQTEIKSKRNKSKLNKETMKYEKDYKKRTWVDFKSLGKLLNPYKDNEIIYTVEKVLVKPGEGEPNSFVFGNAMGIFQGLYTLLNPIDYYEPLAVTWKKDLGVSSIKDTSVELCESIYNVKLRDIVSKGKVDDIAEALLLAFYGLKQYYSKEQ